MKQLLVYTFSLISCVLYAQQSPQLLRGRLILYDKEGISSPEDISIRSKYANETHSAYDGSFTLRFIGSKVSPGDTTKLIIGQENKYEILRTGSEASEYKNNEILVTLPKSKIALKDIHLIYTGAKTEVVLRLYKLRGILVDRYLASLKEKEEFIKDYQELLEERVKLIKEAEERAEYIAFLERNDVSEIVDEALRLLENENDVDRALEVLENERILAIYKKSATDHKVTAKKTIEAFEFKISLLKPFSFEEKAALLRQILEIKVNENYDRNSIAETSSALYSVYAELGEVDLALKYAQRAVDEQLISGDSISTTISAYYDNLGNALREKGVFKTAIKFHKKALLIDSMSIKHTVLIVTKNDSLNNQSKFLKLATTYNNLAASWRQLGDLEKAFDYHQISNSLVVQVYGSVHSKVAIGYNNLGLTCYDLKDLDRATEYLKKSLTIALEIASYDGSHPSLARIYNNLGLLWTAKGNYDLAIFFHQKSLECNRSVFSLQHPILATDYNNLGLAWSYKLDFKKALDYFSAALEIGIKVFGENHPKISQTYVNMAGIWEVSRNYNVALKLYKKSLSINSSVRGESHPKTIDDYKSIGRMYEALGDFANAVNNYSRALISLEDKKDDKNQLEINEIQNSIALNEAAFGMSFLRKGVLDSAFLYYEKSLIHAKLINNNDIVIASHNNIVSILTQLKKHKEALKFAEEGIQLAQRLDLETLSEFESQPDSLKQNPSFELEKQSKLYTFATYSLRLYQVCNLKALRRNTKAKKLMTQLETDAADTHDDYIINLVRKGCGKE